MTLTTYWWTKCTGRFCLLWGSFLLWALLNDSFCEVSLPWRESLQKGFLVFPEGTVTTSLYWAFTTYHDYAKPFIYFPSVTLTVYLMGSSYILLSHCNMKSSETNLAQGWAKVWSLRAETWEISLHPVRNTCSVSICQMNTLAPDHNTNVLLFQYLVKYPESLLPQGKMSK